MSFLLLLSPLQPCPDLIDAPNHGHDEDGHGRHQPKESHGVVEVILPRVIAKGGKDDERHLVHQMVNDGEPLHAQGQADEMAIGLVLNHLAGLFGSFHHRLVNLRQLPLLAVFLRQFLDVAFQGRKKAANGEKGGYKRSVCSKENGALERNQLTLGQ